MQQRPQQVPRGARSKDISSESSCLEARRPGLHYLLHTTVTGCRLLERRQTLGEGSFLLMIAIPGEELSWVPPATIPQHGHQPSIQDTGGSQNHLGGLLQHGSLGPIPTGSDSVGWGWGSRICISNKSQGNADASGLGSALWGPLRCIYIL